MFFVKQTSPKIFIVKCFTGFSDPRIFGGWKFVNLTVGGPCHASDDGKTLGSCHGHSGSIHGNGWYGAEVSQWTASGQNCHSQEPAGLVDTYIQWSVRTRYVSHGAPWDLVLDVGTDGGDGGDTIGHATVSRVNFKVSLDHCGDLPQSDS